MASLFDVAEYKNIETALEVAKALSNRTELTVFSTEQSLKLSAQLRRKAEEEKKAEVQKLEREAKQREQDRRHNTAKFYQKQATKV